MEEGTESLTFKKWLKINLLTILLALGVILGFAVAIICILFADTTYISRITMCVGFPGELLINGLQCMALPLAVSGLILSVTSMRLWDYCMLLIEILIFAFLLVSEAAAVGVLCSCWIIPNNLELDIEIPDEEIMPYEKNITFLDNYLDIVRYLFPPNVITMTMMHYKTVLISDGIPGELFEWDVSRYGTMEGGTNVYGVVSYSIFFAAALSTLLEKGDTFKRIFETLNYMSLMITKWLLYVTPLFSVFLVAAGAIEAEFSNYLVPEIGNLIIAIVAAHAVQLFVVYPLIYYSLAWENPYKPMLHYFNAIIVAFVTKSSWSTYPITILSLEDKGKVPSTLAKFVMPIAQAIRKDGSAIYFTSALFFVYRTTDNPVNISTLLSICITGIITSFAGSGVPYSNFLCITIMVEAFNLPTTSIPLFVAVEWIAGRTANVVNVVGDLYLVKILAIYNKETFEVD